MTCEEFCNGCTSAFVSGVIVGAFLFWLVTL